MLRLRSIYSRLLLFSLGGTFLLALSFSLVVHFNYQKHLTQELERRGGILATGIAMSTQKALLTDNPARIKSIVDLYKIIDPDIMYVVIINKRGNIVYHTFAQGFPADLEKIMKANNAANVLLQTDMGFIRDIPSPIYGGEAGMAHLGISEDRIRAQVAYNQRITLGIVFGITALSIVVITFLSRSVTTPINRVIRAAEQFGGGDTSHRIDVTSSGETGRLAQAFNIMADQIEQHQRQLVQVEKLAAIGRLSSGIAHEINNPLMGVQNACRIIKSEREFSPKTDEYLDLIDDSLGKIEKIVRSLLVSSRHTDAPPAEFSLCMVVDKAVNLARHVADRKRVTIACDKDHDADVQVFGSADRLQQVVLNLLINAVDAAPRGTDVRIEGVVDPGTNFAKLVVKDHGPGIPAVEQDRIFEPFFTTKGPGVGTGLGLYVCHQIVQEMNGRINVMSMPGRGTSFYVRIPLAKSIRNLS